MRGWTVGTGRSVGAPRAAHLNGQDGRSGRGGIVGIMSLAACLVAGCGEPVAPLQAVQPASPGVVQASIAETPYECREVTFTITGPETVVGQWPDSTCREGIKVIAGAPMEWQEEGGRRLRMIVRYVNLTGVPVGLPLDVMLPVGNKFPLDPPTAAHSTMVPLEFDSLGINGRTWWILAGPAGVLGVGDTSRVDTLLFQIKSPVLSARFRFNHYPVEATVSASVPAQAPDTLPAWTQDDSSYARGGWLKRVLNIQFEPVATQADRESIIAQVGGIVIGGFSSSLEPEGDYYVLLSGNPSLATADSIATVLEADPRVRFASAAFRGAIPGARLPGDAQGWTRADWVLNPDSAGGINWAAEEIAAPLAWSCGTGNATVRIAVLDHPFDQTEMASNAIAPLPVFGAAPANPARHGTAVAGLIASPGDNGVGLAGLLWRASVLLDDLGPGGTPWPEMAERIGLAAKAGNRIVNLSYRDTVFRQTSADSTRIRDNIRRMAAKLRTVSQTQLPLIVVIAGNENDDAWLSVLPALKDSFPDNVLVVGGSTIGGPGAPRDRWGGSNFTRSVNGGSNHGRLIDVYAPAVDVTIPVLSGGVEMLAIAQGTSYSAPLVTGIAGLLLSLDPTLTPSELRQLILAGAAAGGRSMASDPGRFVVNAWESLKLASNKPGTPLCGKTVRTVLSGNQELLLIDRTASITETLIPSRNTFGIRTVSVAQGGRKIATMGSFSDPQYTDVFTLGSGGTWTLGADSSGFMIQYLEQDTAYFRSQDTATREDLFVRIGSTVQTREVGEIRVTAAGPTGPFWADWSWEWPSVSPTGDWVLFNWIHDTACDEVYTIFAVPLRGGGSPVEALRSAINWCSATDYPPGFTWFGPTAWRADGRAFVSPRQAMPSNPSGPIDMSIRQFSVSGSGVSPTGTSATVLNRIPRGVFWESEGARIRIAEQPHFGSCEVTARAASNTSSVLAVLGPCNTFPYVGASLRAEEGPGTTSGRPGRRVPPWAALQTSIGGIPFDPQQR